MGQLHFSLFGVEARQVVFDGLQSFEHLDRQKKLGPLLRLDNCHIRPSRRYPENATEKAGVPLD